MGPRYLSEGCLLPSWPRHHFMGMHRHVPTWPEAGPTLCTHWLCTGPATLERWPLGWAVGLSIGVRWELLTESGGPRPETLRGLEGYISR